MSFISVGFLYTRFSGDIISFAIFSSVLKKHLVLPCHHAEGGLNLFDELFLEGLDNLLWFTNDTSETSKVLDRQLTVDGELDILDHLSCVDLADESVPLPLGGLNDLLAWERPEGDRTEESDLNALLTSQFDGFLTYAGSTSETDYAVIGIITLPRLLSHLLLPYHLLLLLHV